MCSKKKTHNFWFVLFSLTRYCWCLLFFSSMYLLSIMKHFTSRVGWLIIKGCINNVQLHLTKKCNSKKKNNNNNNFSQNTGSFSSQMTWLMFLRLSPNVSRVKPRLSPGSAETQGITCKNFFVCVSWLRCDFHKQGRWLTLAGRQRNVCQSAHSCCDCSGEGERESGERQNLLEEKRVD